MECTCCALSSSNDDENICRLVLGYSDGTVALFKDVNDGKNNRHRVAECEWINRRRSDNNDNDEFDDENEYIDDDQEEVLLDEEEKMKLGVDCVKADRKSTRLNSSH